MAARRKKKSGGSTRKPTVSLYVHERIDPKSILAAARRRSGAAVPRAPDQMSVFEAPQENPPLREALDFYKHAHGSTKVDGDAL